MYNNNITTYNLIYDIQYELFKFAQKLTAQIMPTPPKT
jgi:hypothetical protein